MYSELEFGYELTAEGLYYNNEKLSINDNVPEPSFTEEVMDTYFKEQLSYRYQSRDEIVEYNPQIGFVEISYNIADIDNPAKSVSASRQVKPYFVTTTNDDLLMLVSYSFAVPAFYVDKFDIYLFKLDEHKLVQVFAGETTPIAHLCGQDDINVSSGKKYKLSVDWTILKEKQSVGEMVSEIIYQYSQENEKYIRIEGFDLCKPRG